MKVYVFVEKKSNRSVVIRNTSRDKSVGTVPTITTHDNKHYKRCSLLPLDTGCNERHETENAD
jgi:hypothetical protein